MLDRQHGESMARVHTARTNRPLLPQVLALALAGELEAAGDEALAEHLADLPGIATLGLVELAALEGEAVVHRLAEVGVELLHLVDEPLRSLHHRLGAAVGLHDLHRLQVVVRRVLEVLHGLHLVLRRQARAFRGSSPHEEQLAEEHIALVDAGAHEGVQVHHAQLDVADTLAQALQAVGPEVLQADGIVQLGGVANHARVDIGLDGVGVGRRARVIQNGREEVPVAELGAAHRGQALEQVAADLALLHEGRVHDRARGHDRGEDPAPGDAVLGQAHV